MRSLLRRRERRGLTWAELSAESGVPRSTLHFWARRLRSEDQPPDPAFVRLAIAEAPPARSDPIEVVSHSGQRVLLRPGFDPDTLRRVLEVLDAGC
ncbi:MAG: hypothetical protein ACE5F1_19170 [Planctomycetota bacterium]